MATYGPTNATSDNYIDIFNPTTNNSANTSLVIDGTFSNTLHRALMKWDVSSIPAGATISSASLALRVTTNTSISGTGDIYPVTRDFTMSQSSWNNYATGNAWTVAGGDYDGSFGSRFTFATGATPLTQTIDVTTAVAKAIASYQFSGVIGLLAKRTTEPTNPGAFLVSSVEGTTPPALTITYTAGPSSGTMMLLGVGT